MQPLPLAVPLHHELMHAFSFRPYGASEQLRNLILVSIHFKSCGVMCQQSGFLSSNFMSPSSVRVTKDRGSLHWWVGDPLSLQERTVLQGDCCLHGKSR